MYKRSRVMPIPAPADVVPALPNTQADGAFDNIQDPKSSPDPLVTYMSKSRSAPSLTQMQRITYEAQMIKHYKGA